MKKILMMIAVMATALGVNAQGVEYVESDLEYNHDDALTIILIHQGTQVAEATNSTIAGMTKHMKEQFSGRNVVEIYQNPTAGARSKNLDTTLEDIYYDGDTFVVFQPTYIGYNDFMAEVMSKAKPFSYQFKDIRIAKPLLFDNSDSEAIVAALKGDIESSNDAVILVANGKYEALSAEQMAMMQSALQGAGLSNWYIVDSNDAASSQAVVASLEQSGVKSATLQPFSFLASVTSAQDVVADMQQLLQTKGLTVDSTSKGLGDIEAIRQLYFAHTSRAMRY